METHFSQRWLPGSDSLPCPALAVRVEQQIEQDVRKENAALLRAGCEGRVNRRVSVVTATPALLSVLRERGGWAGEGQILSVYNAARIGGRTTFLTIETLFAPGAQKAIHALLQERVAVALSRDSLNRFVLKNDGEEGFVLVFLPYAILEDAGKDHTLSLPLRDVTELLRPEAQALFSL